VRGAASQELSLSDVGHIPSSFRISLATNDFAAAAVAAAAAGPSARCTSADGVEPGAPSAAAVSEIE
jgi:hypothetical protein